MSLLELDAHGREIGDNSTRSAPMPFCSPSVRVDASAQRHLDISFLFHRFRYQRRIIYAHSPASCQTDRTRPPIPNWMSMSRQPVGRSEVQARCRRSADSGKPIS